MPPGFEDVSAKWFNSVISRVHWDALRLDSSEFEVCRDAGTNEIIGGQVADCGGDI